MISFDREKWRSMPLGEGFVAEKGTDVEVCHSREILPIANPVNPGSYLAGCVRVLSDLPYRNRYGCLRIEGPPSSFQPSSSSISHRVFRGVS